MAITALGFGINDSPLNCLHNQSRAKAALPACNTFLESCSLNAITLGGEIVPIHRRALFIASMVRGLLTVIEPSGSIMLPPPYDTCHSKALQVRPS
jgi:hypothetical protein